MTWLGSTIVHAHDVAIGIPLCRFPLHTLNHIDSIPYIQINIYIYEIIYPVVRFGLINFCPK